MIRPALRPEDFEGDEVCGAVHHDLTGAPAWCKLATGHDGMHDDGALQWEHREPSTILENENDPRVLNTCPKIDA